MCRMGKLLIDKGVTPFDCPHGQIVYGREPTHVELIGA